MGSPSPLGPPCSTTGRPRWGAPSRLGGRAARPGPSSPGRAGGGAEAANGPSARPRSSAAAATSTRAPPSAANGRIIGSLPTRLTSPGSAAHTSPASPGLAAVGWGDSNSGPSPEAVPGGGCAGELTCGSLAPVVTARARCAPLPAGSVCTHRVPAGPRPGTPSLHRSAGRHGRANASSDTQGGATNR